MAISPEQFKNTVAPFLGIKIDKSLGQKALDQLINSNPALAAKMGAYNKVLDGAVSGNPVLRVAKGGYIFASDELGDPRVKEEMKDNPEFSEFSIDQQDATANKLQQRFAQPEDRMQQQQPARGYAVGGQPPLLDAQKRVSLPDEYFTNSGPQQATRTGPGTSFSTTDMRDRSMDGYQGPARIQDARLRQPLDPNRPYPPMVSDPISKNGGGLDIGKRNPYQIFPQPDMTVPRPYDPKRPPDFKTNRPYQPDSKIARADTRKFGQQPDLIYQDRPVPFQPPRPGGGGNKIPLQEGQFPETGQLFNNMPSSKTPIKAGLSFEEWMNSPENKNLGTMDAGPLGIGRGFQNDPEGLKKAQLEMYKAYQVGPDSTMPRPSLPPSDLNKLADAQKDIMMKTYTDPGSVITAGVTENIVPSDYNEIAAGTGQVTGDPSVDLPTATDVATADVPTAEGPAGVMTATTAADKVKAATDAMTAKTGAVGDDAQVTAATEDKSAVSDLEAAQGTANVMENPVKRKVEAGELVSGAADAATAAAFTEQVQAATATPSDKATVKGQLDTLMDDFDGGETPVWAAGAMRAANAAMAARGLGASSMAGQAIIQAAMESAIPIAQADASTTAQFEMQNLSNRQQRAMLAAQQRATFIGQEFDQEFQSRVANSSRIGDIANMNFTADQQIALENGRAANTMNMANLSNSQAMVMAEAAALSQLDISNLNNRQQAAVQNAQNFMQMDMQNLSNEQQTSMFKQQQVTASLFTDQAAENAASQLNATSETQTQQFFASLANQTSQFNSTQTNAMSTFDAEQTNTLKRFNAELDNQRDQFNATNGLAVAQSNAQWRQNATTLNTAAANEANMEYAKNVNGLTGTALDQLWQRERDLMSFAFTGSESAADRAVKIAVAKLTGQQQADLADQMGQGSFFSTILTGILGNAFGFGK